MIRRVTPFAAIFIFQVLVAHLSFSQDGPIQPTVTGFGTYHGLTPPLRELPVISEEEFRKMEADAGLERNSELRHRSYPFAGTALPDGPDPAWQREMGPNRTGRGLLMNIQGLTSPYYPPDANGTAGPQYYMQTINTIYAIYNKSTGAIVAGPTNMNQLFAGAPGSNCNDGDPLILYDEQAERWLAVEFSLCTSNDRMLVAVSQTNDPTGSWHVYSFDVADTPDYEKFGIWQDGYYMGTNTYGGNDIYVFERSQMLVGGTAQMVGFDNPWRPTTIDGFMCVPPLDNDGTFAPAGEPGLFITINDDAIAGSFDALWIYELDVDWETPANTTFNRVQQLAVPSFDSNFGNTWNNIVQPSTSQKLDAIPQVIMNRPQYRNFGSYETILCCHTVDVDATNHAGIRWYELRREGGQWIIRQSGTYAPDLHSRWMGSISLNGFSQIGLAYSISSATEYPGIRFTGQSETEYAAASGIMDITEEIIRTGTNSQSGANRWGDYADLSVDPDNDHTFWFTTQYIGGGGSRLTRIASFEFTPAAPAAGFSVSTSTPCEGGSVIFSDESTGGAVSWEWTFEGGEPGASTEQDPVVAYAVAGQYDVQLVISDGTLTDTLLQEDFIYVLASPATPGAPAGPVDICTGDDAVEYVTDSPPFALHFVWSVEPVEAGEITGDDTVGTLAVSESYSGQAFIRVQASNDCGNSTFSDSLAVNIHPGPAQFNLSADGGFCQGGEGAEVYIDGSEATAIYELFRDGMSTDITLPGYGDTLSFGFQTIPGEYSVKAHSFTCSIGMNGSTTVYFLPAVETTAQPEGPAEVCNSNRDDEYVTAGATHASRYIWALEPATAGTITGSTATGRVDWSPDFSGTALVTVRGANDCGEGPASEAFAVTVIDAPHPAVTGQEIACNVASGKVYSYNTPENPDNEYYWTVVGGDLVTGQGSGAILVTWNATGDGRLTVAESAASGCSTVADTLMISIVNCTGIDEQEQDQVFLFPNPVENELTVRCHLDRAGTARLHIFNSYGREVISQKVESDNGKVDLTLSTAGLAAGTYHLKLVSSGGRVYGGKFVKAE